MGKVGKEQSTNILNINFFLQIRFQKESAIPLKFQQRVLENVVEHLFDKGALARKAAAACVTTFLSYNAYSANVSYEKYVIKNKV